MRASHFAAIHVLVPPDDYSGKGTAAAQLKMVGMAQSISVSDSFGSRAENVLGTPLPVLAPGYMQTTIRMEKATIDGADFRNLGAFNPLWAHVGSTYRAPVEISAAAQSTLGFGANNTKMFPFMFVLAIRNRVPRSYSKSNITYDNKTASSATDAKARAAVFGMYVCVLQGADVSLSANQAVIMDSVTAVARPVSGTWLSDKLKSAFIGDGDSAGKNGMKDLIYDIMWGYSS